MDLSNAIEALAQAHHENAEASSLESAAHVIEADKRGEVDHKGCRNTIDHETCVRKAHETLQRGPVAWEDMAEGQRDHTRDYVRGALGPLAPALVVWALHDHADYIYKEWPGMEGAEIAQYLLESSDELDAE